MIQKTVFVPLSSFNYKHLGMVCVQSNILSQKQQLTSNGAIISLEKQELSEVGGYERVSQSNLF